MHLYVEGHSDIKKAMFLLVIASTERRSLRRRHQLRCSSPLILWTHSPRAWALFFGIENSRLAYFVVDVEDLKNGEQNQVEQEVVMVEDSKNEKDAVIEDLNNEVEAMAIDDLMYKEQSQVEEEEMVVADSKNEKEIVIEHLNEENEVIMGTEEQVSEETEVPYVQNEMRSDSEGLTMGVSSAKSSSSGPVDRNIILDFVFDKSDAIESELTDLANKEVESVAEIEELTMGVSSAKSSLF